MDRDLLPKNSVKKLGLLKINLLPKKNATLVGKFPTNYCYLQPPVSRIDRTYNNSVYKKKYLLQEKNLIYVLLADNIRHINMLYLENMENREGKYSPHVILF